MSNAQLYSGNGAQGSYRGLKNRQRGVVGQIGVLSGEQNQIQGNGPFSLDRGLPSDMAGSLNAIQLPS